MKVTPYQKKEMCQTLRDALAIVEALPEDRSCRLCEHFEELRGYCSEWRSNVPSDARAQGCERWESDIPF